MDHEHQHPQIDKFKEAARELETDEREEAFDRVVRRIAKTPSPKDAAAIKNQK